MADAYRVFCDYIKENHIFSDNDKVIIGLSGGADSMCLLLMLHKLSEELHLKLTAVHVNHQLRGLEADADEEYVKEFCKKLDVPCIGVHAAVRSYAFTNNLSLEEAGRTARYQTFYQVARKIAGSDEIPGDIKAAVAHHRDDNAETILMNLIRGTGLKGLQGMQPVAERFGMTVVRPLLCLGREEIEKFLKEEKVEFRTDSTNLEDEYARNKVRLNIIPQLNTVNNQAAAHINEAARSIVQAQEFIEEEAIKVQKLIVDRRQGGCYIDLDRFSSLHTVVKAQIIRNVIEEIAGSLKDVGRVHIDSVLSLENKQTGRRVELPYGIMAQRSYSNIIIKQATAQDNLAKSMIDYVKAPEGTESQSEKEAEAKPEEPEAFMIDVSQLSTEPVVYRLWEGMEIELRLVYVNPVTRQYLTANIENTKAFDCAKIKGNLLIRRPEAGDEIQFFGGKKTVRKFFVDEKVPKEERQNALVLADESRVMWIIGYRISETYKISEMTTLALQVRISVSGGVE